MLSAANIKLGAVILGWLSATVTTVVLNKHIFQFMKWQFPLTLTIVHMVICAIGSFLFLRTLKVIPFTTIDNDEYFKGVLPLRYAILSHIQAFRALRASAQLNGPENRDLCAAVVDF